MKTKQKVTLSIDVNIYAKGRKNIKNLSRFLEVCILNYSKKVERETKGGKQNEEVNVSKLLEEIGDN